MNEFHADYVKDYWSGLVDKHPAMFEHLWRPPECDKGWEELLDNLMTNLEQLLKGMPGAILEVIQIKEKFGGLRFYVNTKGDWVSQEDLIALDDLIQEAERLSYSICEKCGAPGSTRRDRSWVRTLCDVHAEQTEE